VYLDACTELENEDEADHQWDDDSTRHRPKVTNTIFSRESPTVLLQILDLSYMHGDLQVQNVVQSSERSSGDVLQRIVIQVPACRREIGE